MLRTFEKQALVEKLVGGVFLGSLCIGVESGLGGSLSKIRKLGHVFHVWGYAVLFLLSDGVGDLVVYGRESSVFTEIAKGKSIFRVFCEIIIIIIVNVGQILLGLGWREKVEALLLLGVRHW